MTENRNLIPDIYNAIQKITFFLFAASASAIAFTVSQIKDSPLDWSMIWIAISICLWSYSVYCGYDYTTKLIEGLKISSDVSDNFPQAGIFIQESYKHIKIFKNQFYFFCTEVYLIWIFTGMIYRTIQN